MFKNYKKEWLILLLGLLVSIASFGVDICSVEVTIWFQRSGALLVLLAAIVEYRIAGYSHDEIYEAIKDTARRRAVVPDVSGDPQVNDLIKSNIASKPEVPSDRARVKTMAHALIVLGTAVWGYGDLVVG